MSDNCPFCKAGPKIDRSAWECGTIRTIFLNKEEGFIRGSECYETQIANLQAAVDEAREILKKELVLGRKEWLAKYGDKID